MTAKVPDVKARYVRHAKNLIKRYPPWENVSAASIVRIVALLAHYDETVVAKVCDPMNGISFKYKRLPSLDIIERELEAVLHPPDPFFSSPEWRRVRYEALKGADGVCQCCGAPPQRDKPLHVDHIKPRSRFPDLALDPDNLQVLCVDCNLGKGASDQTDWRR
jgi:hypothetical protein